MTISRSSTALDAGLEVGLFAGLLFLVLPKLPFPGIEAGLALVDFVAILVALLALGVEFRPNASIP